MSQAIAAQPGPRAMDRRDSVWTACDALAAQGVKPTLSKIRPLHRGGSDTDVQADIQSWFAKIFKNHLAQTDGLDLPKDVAALMRQLWDSAQGAADAQLQAERDTLNRQRIQWEGEAAQANIDKDSATERANELDRDLAGEREKAASLARSVVDLEGRLSEALAEARLERARSEGLSSDMATMSQRHSEETRSTRESHAAELSDIRQAHASETSIARQSHAEEISALRVQLSQRSEHYNQEIKLAEDRLRAAEKRLMLEQDAVRHSAAEWKRKAQEEREAGDTKVSVVRKQMEELLTQAAGLRALLSSSEKSREESRASAAKAQTDLAQLAQAIAQGAGPTKD